MDRAGAVEKERPEEAVRLYKDVIGGGAWFCFCSVSPVRGSLSLRVCVCVS